MEETHKKRKRMKRSAEFYELCRKARHQGEFALKGRVSTKPVETKEEQAMALDTLSAEPPRSSYHRKPHSMMKDKESGEWCVRVPSPKGRTRYVTTGETDEKKALRIVDASGVPQLSVLARARCLTHSAAAIIMADQNKTCAQVAKVWLRDLALDQAVNTCRMYGMYVDLFFEVNGYADMPPSSITREAIHAFVNDPNKKHMTRRMRLNAVVSFFRHATGFGHVTGNLASTIKINLSMMTVAQREQMPAAPITEVEYRQIMASHQIPRFWRVATSLGYWLGLRLVDVCKLERASLGADFAVLYPHKTGRRLIMSLHDPLIGSGELLALAGMLLAATPPGQTLLFPVQSEMYDAGGAKLSTEYINALESIGIVGKSFHGLRHSFRIRLSASGKPIEEVSRLMGHASTRVTEGYGRAVA